MSDKAEEKTETPTISPRHNCKKCHGTGRIGFIDGDNNKPLVCNCVLNAYRKLDEKTKRLITKQAINT